MTSHREFMLWLGGKNLIYKFINNSVTINNFVDQTTCKLWQPELQPARPPSLTYTSQTTLHPFLPIRAGASSSGGNVRTQAYVWTPPRPSGRRTARPCRCWAICCPTAPSARILAAPPACSIPCMMYGTSRAPCAMADALLSATGTGRYLVRRITRIRHLDYVSVFRCGVPIAFYCLV